MINTYEFPSWKETEGKRETILKSSLLACKLCFYMSKIFMSAIKSCAAEYFCWFQWGCFWNTWLVYHSLRAWVTELEAGKLVSEEMEGTLFSSGPGWAINSLFNITSVHWPLPKIGNFYFILLLLPYLCELWCSNLQAVCLSVIAWFLDFEFYGLTHKPDSIICFYQNVSVCWTSNVNLHASSNLHLQRHIYPDSF